MKSKNCNNASRKTKQLIKNVFAELLSEKRELGKISVSELCQRADISRGAFYSHYDDIYCVAEEYETELIDTFFDSARLLESQNIYSFIDSIFEFIRQNDENYRLLCRSNELFFTAKKLSSIATAKFIELCCADERIKNYTYLELDIQVFLDGLFCEYVKYCRGYVTRDLDDLYGYTCHWVAGFIERHSS